MRVLVILMFGDAYRTGGAVDHVAGFSSEQQCLVEAGKIKSKGTNSSNPVVTHCLFAPQLK